MSFYLGIISDGVVWDTEELDAETLDEAERECREPDRDSGLPHKPGFVILDDDSEEVSKWDGIRWVRS